VYYSSCSSLSCSPISPLSSDFNYQAADSFGLLLLVLYLLPYVNKDGNGDGDETVNCC